MKIHLSCVVAAPLFGAIAATALTGCTAEMKKTHWLGRAERDFEAGKYDKAKISYMKVLQVDPKNVRAFQQLGAIWLEGGAPLRAGAFLRKAEELDPQDSANRLRLARVYRAIGQRDEARKEVLAALQQIPGNGEALLLLTEFAATQEEIDGIEQAVQAFPAKETALHELAIANIALREQNVSGALQAIERAIELDPKLPEAHQAAGVLDLLQKNPEGAGEKLKTASDLAPTRSTVQMVYAEYLREHHRGDAGSAFLRKLTDKAPDFLPAWILLSRIAFSEKNYDGGLKFLENVFSRDPQNVDARLLQSEAWLAQHEPRKAIAELERLDHTYPALPPLKYRLAQAYLMENKPAQAAAALDQAITANPEYVEAVLLRAQLMLRTGDTPAAISALEGMLIKHRDFKPAQLLLADAYRASGRLDDAADIFQKQIDLSPRAPEPYFFLGVIQQQQQKSPEARQSFEKVLELAPDNLPAVGQLIDLDLQAKDFPAATRRVEAQLEKHPGLATPYLLEGKIQVAKQEWKRAETALKKALELDANLGPAYEMLVSIYVATDRLPDAVREIETILSKAPENESALMTLAVIQEKQKSYQKAGEAYEKVLALNPIFVPALNNLSYLCAEHLNQLDKSYELAQKARSLDPANPTVADTLGWALFKRGDYQQALVLLQESADKSRGAPEIEFHLGMAHYMMGQTDAARTSFQQAIAAKEDFPGRSEAESRLALLGDASGQSRVLSVKQLEQRLKDEPNDLIARIRVAQAYEEQGAWAAAVEAYEGALKLNPKLASTALKLAQLHSGPAPNKEKALTYAKIARGLSPDDPKATAVLGRVAFDTGDFPWAYSLLQESARQLASDPKVLHDFAWSAYSLGKVEAAREAMERSLQGMPTSEIAGDAKIFLDLTTLETNSTALSSARPQIEARLKVNPKYVPALMAAATLDIQNGNKAGALDRFHRVLQQFPDFAPAQRELASLYADGGSVHSEEAYNLASKARKALPDDPAVAQLFGQLTYQKKDYRRAIQLLRESAAKRPLDAVGLYYLGLSYKEAREPGQAGETLNQAIAKGLPIPLMEDASSALAELKKSQSE